MTNRSSKERTESLIPGTFRAGAPQRRSVRPVPFARFSPLNLLSWRPPLASQAEADIQPPQHHGPVQGEVEVSRAFACTEPAEPRTCRPEPRCWHLPGHFSSRSPVARGCPLLGPRLGVAAAAVPRPRSLALAYLVTCAFLLAGPRSSLPCPRSLIGSLKVGSVRDTCEN